MNVAGDISVEALKALFSIAFEERKLTVFEAYSDYGSELSSFGSAKDLSAFVDAALAKEHPSVYVALFAEGFGPGPIVRRINLDPRRCQGHSFRYQVQGWGLIFLQFDPVRGYAKTCNISVNSKARAISWSPTYPELGDPLFWDWQSIEKFFRRLGRVMKKLEASSQS